MSTESQFLIPVHEIMRRPGQMRELELDLTVDEPLGEGAMSIRQGSVIEVDLRLESVHEGI